MGQVGFGSGGRIRAKGGRQSAGAAQLAGRQAHDANIVATMLAHGEDRLLTVNRSDFRRFEPRIEIVEP